MWQIQCRIAAVDIGFEKGAGDGEQGAGDGEQGEESEVQEKFGQICLNRPFSRRKTAIFVWVCWALNRRFWLFLADILFEYSRFFVFPSILITTQSIFLSKFDGNSAHFCSEGKFLALLRLDSDKCREPEISYFILYNLSHSIKDSNTRIDCTIKNY